MPPVRPEGNPVFRSAARLVRAVLVPAGSLVIWTVLSLAHTPSAKAIAAITLPGFGVLQIASQFASKVSANSRALVTRELQTRLAVADRQVLSTAHGELASLVRSIDQSRSVLARSSEKAALELQPLLEDILAACQRARRLDPSSAFPDVPNPDDESSSVLVDRWARVERTPAWWPMGVRELWASTAASWLDSIRLLHTREIERVALAGTLLLRATVVVMAPLADALTIGGIVPFGRHVALWRDIAWSIVAGWSGLVALAASWVLWRIIDSGDRAARRGLLACESIVSVAALLAAPSWMTFAFVAGPLNWAMRPSWRSRPLALATAAFTVLFTIGLLLAPGGVSRENLLLEIVLGLACVAVISNSFGLLLPIVVAHVLFVLPAWHQKATRFQHQQWRQRVEPIMAGIDKALERAELSRQDSPGAAETAAQLVRARAHVHRLLVFPQGRSELVRRRTLGQILDAVLGRVANDSERPLRAAAPSFSPADLEGARLASWRVANHLEVALSRIASEALRHGDFEIRCMCRAVEPDLVIQVENDVAPDSVHCAGDGQGRGAREITTAIGQLRDGRLLRREMTTGVSGIPVFVVEFAFRQERKR